MKRLALLQSMKRQLRGASTLDEEILRRSFRAAPFNLIRDLDKYRYPTLLDDATVVADQLGTFPVRGGTDDLAHSVPDFQADVIEMIKRFATVGGVVIDAGANIGAMTVAASKCVGATGQVLAIEMMPDTAEILRNTINLNNLANVQVYQYALSNKSGDRVTAQVKPGLHGQASIARDDNRTGLIDVSVETMTLDEITAGYDKIDFIKMDIEGAEPMALRGAADTLRKTSAMIVEVLNPDTSETPKMLEEAGFQLTWKGRDVLAVRYS